MSNPAPGFSRHPNHHVVATQSPRHVRVLAAGEVLADTRAAFEVDESGHDPVWYFPPEDVARAMLEATETTTYCPFKGQASYYTVEAGGERLQDAAWSYLTPYDECRALAGYIAFYPDKVRIEVDGQSR